MYEVVEYRADLKEEWDRFIDNSKNSSFLLKRDYMEYHSDRFEDASILVYQGSKIMMVFPANKREEGIVGSHDGLTYGGFVFGKEIKLPVALSVISEALKFYQEEGFQSLEVKFVPRFYHSIPSDEVDYAMFICEAQLYRRDTAFVIDQQSRIAVMKGYLRQSKKAKASGYFVQEEETCGRFWDQILVPNLLERFGVKPVHSLEEIEFLRGRFPENIRCFTACSSDGVPVAGTLMYLSGNVAHAQYISGADLGRSSGALNMLFIDLIDEVLAEYRYFDFGIANEKQGRVLNHGLTSWKERMGGRSTIHDFYRIDTSRWKSLEDVSQDQLVETSS